MIKIVIGHARAGQESLKWEDDSNDVWYGQALQLL